MLVYFYLWINSKKHSDMNSSKTCATKHLNQLLMSIQYPIIYIFKKEDFYFLTISFLQQFSAYSQISIFAVTGVFFFLHIETLFKWIHLCLIHVKNMKELLDEEELTDKKTRSSSEMWLHPVKPPAKRNSFTWFIHIWLGLF